MSTDTQVVERVIPSPDGGFFVMEAGDGHPVVLIQGLGYATWGWSRLFPSLARTARAIAFDNRGAGRSCKPAGPYTIEMMADDAARVIETLDAGPAHVVGFSMGGYIAQTLVVRRPDLVSSLVLSGTTAGGPTHTPVPSPTVDVWLANAHLPPAEYARATMSLSFAPGWTDEHPDEYDELLAARLEYPTPPECWRAQFEACEAFLSRGIDPATIGVPTLVLHGTLDRIVPVENAYEIAKRLPGAELRILEGRGHLAALEDPATYNAAVLTFFAGLDT